MSFCLPKEFANDFLQALKNGKIDPEKLIDMTSEQRRNFFEDIVGKDNAREVNALLEAKLLLKDQKRGMVSWAKQLTGITEPVRRDIVSKIERMENVLDAKNEEAFLEDLAAKRMGADVTFEEAQHIVEGARAVDEAKQKIDRNSPPRSDSRIEYGLKFDEFQRYVNDLKLEANKISWKEWVTSPNEMFWSLAGTTKSILSSLDNSYFGRQGIKMLYTNPDIWTNAFLKSWADMGKELIGTDAMAPIRADIVSRENALNGKYQAGGYDLGILGEEAFPSSLPEKIPVFGRLYKASESAFNGAALRMRSDYADRIIKKADEFGVDTLDVDQARGLGALVNSMTGRGNIGKLGVIGKEINAAVFSIKFLKSNLDTLSANRLGFAAEKGPARAFVRRQAALNLLKITGTLAAIYTAANTFYPGSVDLDPRSSDFGKIRIKDHTIDPTGGMASIVTLASRITPTYHNGKLSFWYQSKSGKWTDLTAGKYGQQDAVDIINSFWEGKLSPIAGVARNVWQGETFDGQKPTVENQALALTTPLPIQTGLDLAKEENKALMLALMIFEGLGLSTQTDIKR